MTTCKTIAKKLGVLPATVQSLVRRLNRRGIAVGQLVKAKAGGTGKGSGWILIFSKADTEILLGLTSGVPTREAAIQLGCSPAYVNMLAQRFGIANKSYYGRRYFLPEDIEKIRMARREMLARNSEESAARMKRVRPTWYRNKEKHREAGRRLNAAYMAKYAEQRHFHPPKDEAFFSILPTESSWPECSVPYGPKYVTSQWHGTTAWDDEE